MRKWTLGRIFVVAALAVGAVVAGGFAIFTHHAKSEILSAAAAQQTVDAERAKQRVKRNLGSARRVLDEIAGGIRSGAIDSDDDAALESTLFITLLDDPRVEEVTLTRATRLMDGDEPPKDAARRQLSVFREADGAIRTRATRPSAHGYASSTRKHEGGVFATRPFEPPIDAMDPGRHDTFAAIARTGNEDRAIWTDLSWSERDLPLRQDQRRGVVSVQRTVRDKAGRFAGVLRVGLVTRELDELLSPTSEDPERQQFGRVLLLSTPSAGDEVKLVARADPSDRMVEIDGRDVRFVSDRAPAEVAALLSSPILRGLNPNRPEERSQQIAVNGEPWLAATRRLELGPGGVEGWMVVVLVPESHYTAALVRFENTFLVTFAATLGLVVAIGGLLLASVRRGLGRLVGTTDRMRDFDFAQSGDESRVRDLDEVMKGLERAKTVVRAMGKYIPIDLVKKLYADNAEPELGGKPLEISILFTDIEGFTTLSEKLPPDELAKRLGDYLEAMTTAIESTGGTIDKYIGDAVMAVWNAPSPVPNHARAACRAALACMQATRDLYASPAWAGLPSLITRYGVHKAEVLVGHFGAPTRLSYTALGDGVNLAARLEPLCKQYGVIALVSEAIKTDAGDDFIFRRIDRVAVKGKTQGIDVYELLGPAGMDDADLELGRVYEAAFTAYLARDFDRAADLVAPLCEQDPPSKVLFARCCELRRSPPGSDWNGVHVAASK